MVGNFVNFSNFQNQFRNEDFINVWENSLIFVKWYKKNNFLQCGIQTPQLWTWISLKVIELELSYRHLGMIKILNFNLKKKLCKNIQKFLRKCKNQEFCLLKFHVFFTFCAFSQSFLKIFAQFLFEVKIEDFCHPQMSVA